MRSTGDDTFDDVLGGGLPEGGTLLLIGGPGTGASGLARTVLAADEGSDALYLTAEGVSARTGGRVPLPDDVERATVGCEDGEAVLSAHDDAEATVEPAATRPDGGTSTVVLDRSDALAERCGGWSSVVDLLSEFEESGAACVVTATRPDDALVRHATVVAECWQEAVAGEYQPYCRVRHHRREAHDSRRHRVATTPDGAELVARERTGRSPRLATGIEAFDELTGGGFARGGTTVFEHDGAADHWPFTASVCAHVVERGATVVCISAPGIVTTRMNDHLEHRVGDVASLMEQDSLYVVDTVSQASDTATPTSLPDDNVIVQAEVGSLQEAIRSLVADLAGRPVLAILEVTPLLHLVEDDQARQLFYWASANVLAMEGMSLVLAVDGEVAGDQLTAFFSGSAEQAFRTWRADDGIQYVAVEKSPDGSPGNSRAVEPTDEPPYVRLR